MNNFIHKYLTAALENSKRILASDKHVEFCYTAVTFLGDTASCLSNTFPDDFGPEDAAAWVNKTIIQLDNEFPDRMALSRRLAECQHAYDKLVLIATGNYKNPLDELLNKIRAAEDATEDTPEEALGSNDPEPITVS